MKREKIVRIYCKLYFDYILKPIRHPDKISNPLELYIKDSLAKSLFESYLWLKTEELKNWKLSVESRIR